MRRIPLILLIFISFSLIGWATYDGTTQKEVDRVTQQAGL